MIENNIIDLYSNEIKKYGLNDRRSLCWTKDKQDIRFNILLGEAFKCSKMSILDYGCGLCDLKSFLDRNLYNLNYNGCDINMEFIQKSRLIYPHENIFLINSIDDLEGNYDVILVSGTLNLIGIEDYQELESYVFAHVFKLFNRTNYMLVVNFLSNKTDLGYQYDGHFYLDPMKLYDYASNNMTSRIKVDSSSLPYEITMKFFRNCSIDTQTVLYKDS